MTTHFNLIKMKKLLLLIPLIALSCKTAQNCDAYTIKLSPECDSIMVVRYKQMYMPKIPVEGASILSFHNIDKGSYRLNMYKRGNIETIKFKIK